MTKRSLKSRLTNIIRGWMSKRKLSGSWEIQSILCLLLPMTLSQPARGFEATLEYNVINHVTTFSTMEVDCFLANLYFPRARINLSVEQSFITLEAFMELTHKGEYTPYPYLSFSAYGVPMKKIGVIADAVILVASNYVPLELLVVDLHHNSREIPSITLGRDFIHTSRACVDVATNQVHFPTGDPGKLHYFTAVEERKEIIPRDFLVFSNGQHTPKEPAYLQQKNPVRYPFHRDPYFPSSNPRGCTMEGESSRVEELKKAFEDGRRAAIKEHLWEKEHGHYTRNCYPEAPAKNESDEDGK